MSFPRKFQLPTFTPFVKGGAKQLRTNCTTNDFRAVASAFHSEFFSEHPDTEIFTSLVKCILAKILDERTRNVGEEYKFQVLEVNKKEESAQSVFARVNELYSTAYCAYIDTSGKKDTIDDHNFSAERVKTVVKALQGMSITTGAALHGDVIGAFFEEILRNGFKQDKGMYFTHGNLVWFMLEAIDLEALTVETWKKATHPNNRMPYVIDPACGSGTFLLRAMQLMTEAIRSRKDELAGNADAESYFNSRVSDVKPNGWAETFLYGCDPKFVMAITTKVNMVLHGDGSAHIFKWDSLSSLPDAPDVRLRPTAVPSRSLPKSAYPKDLSEQFDAVVSNPPFGVTFAPETKKSLGRTFALSETTPSEGLFIERYAQLLRPGGRLGVVLPESILNGAGNTPVRLLLYRFFWVRAVVSLPRNLFVDTPTLTSLLFAQRKSVAEVREWDRAMETATAAVAGAKAAAKKAITAAARMAGAAPTDVEEAFLVAVAPIGDATTSVLHRKLGAMSFALPASAATVADVLDYYRSMMKCSAFAALCVNAAFAQAAAEHTYEFPVYAVDEVGFKLSKRGERIRPNQLCRFVDPSTGEETPNLQLHDGDVTFDISVAGPQRIIDFIRRDVTWT